MCCIVFVCLCVWFFFSVYICFFFFFFFFQAEDGIRDLTVTGVQTCALPISHHRGERLLGVLVPFALRLDDAHEIEAAAGQVGRRRRRPGRRDRGCAGRSEERRVGKECRCRWSP